MQNDSLVAINITCDNKLLNPTKMPILFYWDGNGNLFDELLKEESFINLINDKCLNIAMFTKTILSCFYFKDENEQYTEFESDIQNIIEINSDLSYDYIISICMKLYKLSMKKEFENFNKLNRSDLIKDIFIQIKSKYKNKFNVESFLNYVRSELQEQYNLNQHNSDIIINTYLKDIVYDK